jgi:hypothetical protein
MLAKSTPQKKSGPPRPPGRPAVSAEAIRLVHSVRDHTPRAEAALLHFAHVLGAERPATLFTQAAREIEGMRSAIGHALTRAEATLDETRLPEMRRTLERLRDEADGVARLMGKLTVAMDPTPTERRVVRLEDVIDLAIDALPASAAVARTVHRDVPPVAGHAMRLKEMLLALLAGAEGPGTVTIETAAREAAVRGEWIVHARLVDRRPGRGPSEADLRTAAGIAREHGGFLGTERTEDNARAFTVDLPAL